MAHPKRQIKVTLLVGLLSTLAAMPLVACECIRIGDAPVDPVSEMRADLATAPAVFLGTVKTVVEVSDPPGFPADRTITIQRRITFSVDEAWKGVRRSEFSIITGTGAGDCGYLFEVGRRYLVVTTESHLYPEKEPQAGICSNTMPDEKAPEYVA